MKDISSLLISPEDSVIEAIEIIDKGLKDNNNLKVKTGKIEKMSKSKKNVVDPNDIINLYGADTARWFMLSDSPPERDLQWSETGIVASFKFINKLYEINKIENLIYFYDPKKLKNVLYSENEIFNTPYYLELINDQEQKKL